ncbi:MAG: ORF6N domain-containing protein [Bacilli bacterium]|nr:ORF6N domain-containing protein [Bacilli bacterium]
MKNEIILLKEEDIKNKIYTIRGKQVMIDSDLAKIYGYSTSAFNQQVKNNIERFDDEYRFQLTDEEYRVLRYKICISTNTNLLSKNLIAKNDEKRGGRTTLPYAFTEEGIYMLISVLKGEKAINQHKLLIKIFKEMKDYLMNGSVIDQSYINNLVLKQENKLLEFDNRLSTVESSINEYKQIEKVFIKGEIYSAYSFILDLFNISKNEIIIVDNYINKELLDLVKDLKSKVIMVTKEETPLISKFKKEYSYIIFIINNSIHDRFIIIDKEIVFNIGSSIKDAGKKTCYISRINNKDEINKLLKTIDFTFLN